MLRQGFLLIRRSPPDRTGSVQRSRNGTGFGFLFLILFQIIISL